jgi:hypothetical protein
LWDGRPAHPTNMCKLFNSRSLLRLIDAINL